MSLEELILKINEEGYWIDLHQKVSWVDGTLVPCWFARVWQNSPLGTIEKALSPTAGFNEGMTAKEALEYAYMDLKLETGELRLTRPKAAPAPRHRGTTLTKEATTQLLLELGL